MARRVDSNALEFVNKALGLGGGGGSEGTELEDAVLDQVLDVGPIIRRGRTPAGTEGIFYGVLETVHAGADDQVARTAVYGMNADLTVEPYANPMPDTFDIWVLGASCLRISGTGGIQAVLSVQYGAAAQAWGVNQATAFIGRNRELPIAAWNHILTNGALIYAHNTEGHVFFQPMAFRLPRNILTELVFRNASTAAQTVDCIITLGVFPVSLGQDAVI